MVCSHTTITCFVAVIHTTHPRVWMIVNPYRQPLLATSPTRCSWSTRGTMAFVVPPMMAIYDPSQRICPRSMCAMAQYLDVWVKGYWKGVQHVDFKRVYVLCLACHISRSGKVNVTTTIPFIVYLGYLSWFVLAVSHDKCHMGFFFGYHGQKLGSWWESTWRVGI